VCRHFAGRLLLNKELLAHISIGLKADLMGKNERKLLKTVSKPVARQFWTCIQDFSPINQAQVATFYIAFNNSDGQPHTGTQPRPGVFKHQLPTMRLLHQAAEVQAWPYPPVGRWRAAFSLKTPVPAIKQSELDTYFFSFD
jgi:hypothetical protein